MKKEELLRAVGEADPAYLREAEPRPPKKSRRSPRIAAVAAALAMVIGLTAFLGRGPIFPESEEKDPVSPIGEAVEQVGEKSESAVPGVTKTAAPNLTAPDAVGNDGAIAAAFAVEEAAYIPSNLPVPEILDPARAAWIEAISADRAAADRLQDFCRRTVPVLLTAGEGVNHLYAPLNLYFALSLLAECTEGKTQQEILDLVGTPDLEELRAVVSAMLRLMAYEGERQTLILSNSLWLDDDVTFKQKTLKTLAEQYNVSSYRGDTADPAYSAALRDWLNQATRHLLSEAVEKEGFEPGDLFAVASAVYFEAGWIVPFRAEKNVSDLFHGKNGDQTAEFMHQGHLFGSYWQTDRGLAFEIPFEQYSGSMIFLLPAEGVTPEEALGDPVLKELFVPNSHGNGGALADADFFLPKFFVTEQKEISDPLKELGVRTAFSGEADFSPLLNQSAVLSRVSHGVGVEVDEHGVKAAAYTVGYGAGGAPQRERIEMKLDRPFLFVVKGEAGLPLFCGIVNQL